MLNQTVLSRVTKVVASSLLVGSVTLALLAFAPLVAGASGDPPGPDIPCPYCDYIGFEVDCYDSHCSQPYPHGVYYRYWCCDCWENCHVETEFRYCHNIC